MSYQSTVLGLSPAVYYRMDDTSGTTCTDSSGNARHGTYTNSPTLNVAGLLAGDPTSPAVSFDGTNDFVTLASAAWMNLGTNMTAIAWVKTSATGNFREIIARYTSSGTRSWEFRENQTTGFVEFIHIGAAHTVAGTSSIRDNVPHMVAVTYDGANIRIYVDGSLQTTSAETAALTNAGDLHIGQRASDLFFPGVIDEVAVFPTALSGASISALYAAGSTLDASVNATVAAATASAVVPVVSGGASVAPAAAVGSAGAVAPVLASDVLVAPPAAVAVGAGLVPLVTTQADDDVTVVAPAAGASASAVVPVVSASASVSVVVPAADSVASCVVPVVSASASATVVVPAAVSLAAGLAPFVTNGSPNVTVLVPAAQAAAVAVVPGLGLDLDTDVSNVFNGRERNGFATVVLTVPVVPVPAGTTRGTRVDKAVPLPLPTLVNGRPT